MTWIGFLVNEFFRIMTFIIRRPPSSFFHFWVMDYLNHEIPHRTPSDVFGVRNQLTARTMVLLPEDGRTVSTCRNPEIRHLSDRHRQARGSLRFPLGCQIPLSDVWELEPWWRSNKRDTVARIVPHHRGETEKKQRSFLLERQRPPTREESPQSIVLGITFIHLFLIHHY